MVQDVTAWLIYMKYAAKKRLNLECGMELRLMGNYARPSHASKLRLWRDRLEVTQSDAATLLGIPFRTYTQWESRRSLCMHPHMLLLACETVERNINEAKKPKINLRKPKK